MMPQFSPHAQTLLQDILFTIEDELSILSIRHGRMLVTLDDTNWH